MTETAPVQRQQFARENADYNRQWFQDLREKVLAGEPLAYVHINVPVEIFRAMGIHVIVNQWWSAVVGSRGKALRYREMMSERGYRDNLCSYCSTGLSSLLETDEAEAPWGGLPKPTVLVSAWNCSSIGKIFDVFSNEFDIPHHALEVATNRKSMAEDVERAADDWKSCYDSRQIDLCVAQYKDLITFLEEKTGRTFSIEKFAEVMRLADEQEEYYRKTRDLIAATRPTPLNINDQLPATVIPQWHRGTEWARDRAKLFYEQTLERVETGQAACPTEKLRLMWLGVGLWHNLSFYTHFEKEYGAVFSWNEYLALAADGYRVAAAEDPVETLAGRMINVMNVIAQDTWYAQQFDQAQLDGVIYMEGAAAQTEGGVCPANFGRQHRTLEALKRAGYPVCVINADPVDARGFDFDSLKAKVSQFIETEVIPYRQAPRASEAVQ